jgi:hypothetical protein
LCAPPRPAASGRRQGYGSRTCGAVGVPCRLVRLVWWSSPITRPCRRTRPGRPPRSGEPCALMHFMQYPKVHQAAGRAASVLGEASGRDRFCSLKSVSARSLRKSNTKSPRAKRGRRTCIQWFRGARLENLSINYEVKGVTKGNAYACSAVETKS